VFQAEVVPVGYTMARVPLWRIVRRCRAEDVSAYLRVGGGAVVVDTGEFVPLDRFGGHDWYEVLGALVLEEVKNGGEIGHRIAYGEVAR